MTPSFLPLASAGGSALDDKVITVGMVALAIWIVSMVIGMWRDLRRQPPASDVFATKSELLSAEARILEQIKGIQDDRKRNSDAVWAKLDALQFSTQKLSDDVNRAIGRLEGRADVMNELKKIVSSRD